MTKTGTSAKKRKTNKEIRQEAAQVLMKSSDIAAVGTIFMLAAVVMVILLEAMIFYASKLLGIEGYQPLETEFYTGFSAGMILLVIRLVIYNELLIGMSYMVHRYFINITQGTPQVAKYMSHHMKKMFLPNLVCGIKLMIYKLMLCLPLFIGIFGISHYYHKGITGDISMSGLVIFMLCIGFSIVWVGELVHYFTSLSLVKYIIQLNPRANFFDACDLSVKLMAGRHREVASFIIGSLPVLLPCVLIYPIALVYPFVTECRTILAREIMGDHWQDKIPAMAKRWEKQLARQQEADNA